MLSVSTVNSGRQSEDEVAHIYTKTESVGCPAEYDTMLKREDSKRKAVALRCFMACV